jgi:hypothetical protein
MDRFDRFLCDAMIRLEPPRRLPEKKDDERDD